MLRYIMPVVVALIWAGVFSFVPEPHRRRLNAILVGGAGAAYISGGSFGLGELAFTALMSPPCCRAFFSSSKRLSALT